MPFTVVELKLWSDIQKYSKVGWIYRGQKKSCWPLRTSLERCFKRQKIENSIKLKIEHDLIREFRRAYHHYSTHVPPESCFLEWLSLMKHYGAPSRLLDFSYSIYVAAYFAVEDMDSDAAIWAIDSFWTVREMVQRLEQAGKQHAKKLKEQFTEKHEEDVCNLFLESPFTKGVCAVNPFRLNERLQIQRGVFLIFGDLGRSFEVNLKSMTGCEASSNLIKIVIPKKMRQEAIQSLWDMNISRTNLFPGLDGFAQSLGVYNPAFSIELKRLVQTLTKRRPE